ncbi:uncharacterized protein PAC_06748 [Phialocephala subalpina]|uniref:Uncharacterized protein n=1 Tax=Phialocephala subalpina TaxID=576137 RepID=A0A1L7WVQ8_9HELO|nr:uncharacterized protein PAC_06748 [Phialocephala subalpina]
MPKPNNGYIVDWICAISTEYVATQAFLDENHDRPEYVSSNNNNDYTLSKIGRHNVVIAVLFDGEYGTTSAAIVARDMQYSFPNIKIGLIVGISGGAPSPTHDIHLSDIVRFQTTGFLNQLLAILRIVMNGLKAQYELKGHQLETAISHAIQENPKLRILRAGKTIFTAIVVDDFTTRVSSDPTIGVAFLLVQFYFDSIRTKKTLNKVEKALEGLLMASAEVEQLIVRLLESGAKVSSSSQAMMASRGYSNYSQEAPRRMIGVHFAAYFGRVETTMTLLKNRHDLDSKDTYGRTALSYAAAHGHEAVVKLLLEKGAELETKDEYYGSRTPLSWAAEDGHEAVVKLLLEKGAELETKDDYGRTPLSWAAEDGHEAVVKLLLEKGAELETKDDCGRTPLSYAAMYGHEAVVKLLLEKGAELETKDKDFGRTPLSWAANNGHEAVLLEKGAELENKDKEYGRTPLSWAAWAPPNGHEAVVKLLLEKGAELETKDNNGRTPLSYAAMYGYEAVAKLLLEKGARHHNSL